MPRPRKRISPPSEGGLKPINKRFFGREAWKEGAERGQHWLDGGKRQWRGWKAANDVSNWLATDFKLMHHRHPVRDCLFIHQFKKKMSLPDLIENQCIVGDNEAGFHTGTKALKMNGGEEETFGWIQSNCNNLWSPFGKKSHKKTKPKQQSWKPDNPKGEKQKITSIAHTPTLSVSLSPEQKSQREVGWKGAFHWTNIYS